MMETPPDDTASSPAPRPRLLLHIGQPKTGTTALQRALHAARQHLLDQHGIYYPVLSSRGTHTRLKPHLLNALDEDARLVHQMGGTHAEAMAESARAWDRIGTDIQKIRPNQVIISSESLYKPLDDGQIARLRGLLDPWFREVQVVVYLRDPVSRFISGAQQRLKIRAEFSRGSGSALREVIESYERLGYPLDVRSFDTARTHPNGVVADFAESYLPDTARDVVIAEDTRASHAGRTVNSSLSAEAMYLMQNLARARAAIGAPLDGDAPLTSRRRAIKELDQEIPGFTRPVLRPAIAEILMRRDRSLTWVRDRYGITFDRIDYDLVGTAPDDGLDPMGEIRDVQQICEVDLARAALIERAIPRKRLARRWRRLLRGHWR